jgi:hypothetical protein
MAIADGMMMMRVLACINEGAASSVGTLRIGKGHEYVVT